MPTVPPSYPVAKALMLLEMKILTTLFNFSGPGWQSFPLSLTLSSSSGKDVHGCSKFFSLHFPISFFFQPFEGVHALFFPFYPSPFLCFFLQWLLHLIANQLTEKKKNKIEIQQSKATAARFNLGPTPPPPPRSLLSDNEREKQTFRVCPATEREKGRRIFLRSLLNHLLSPDSLSPFLAAASL